MLNGVLTTTVNHTAAEAFLRGDKSRAATDDQSRSWSWEPEDMLRPGFFYCHHAAVTLLNALAPGQYTLQYREGMTLTAAEAWDYLAADEARRCWSRLKRVLYRVSGGALQSCDNYPSAAWQDYSQTQTALPGADPYTVAPDAFGESEPCLGYVADLAAERKRVAELGRAAGEREDCWGEAHGALQARLDAALKSLEDTEADLAKAQKRVVELEAERSPEWLEVARILGAQASEPVAWAAERVAADLDIDQLANLLRAGGWTVTPPGGEAIEYRAEGTST